MLESWDIWRRILTDNLFAILATLMMLWGFRKELGRYIWFAPMFYMMFRSLFSVFLFTPTVGIIVNLILGCALLLSFIIYMTNLRLGILTDLGTLGAAVVILWLYYVGHLTLVATVTYMVFFTVFWWRYRRLDDGVYIFAMMFSLSWFTDAREVIIICGYGINFHWPISFLVCGKYFLWLALIPALYGIGVLNRDRWDLLVGLMFTVLANVFQINGLLAGFPLIPYEVMVRLLPLGTILMWVLPKNMVIPRGAHTRSYSRPQLAQYKS